MQPQRVTLSDVEQAYIRDLANALNQIAAAQERFTEIYECTMRVLCVRHGMRSAVVSEDGRELIAKIELDEFSRIGRGLREP